RSTDCARAPRPGSPPGMRKATPGLPTKWPRAPLPNTRTSPTPSTTTRLRPSSPACSSPTAHIRPVSTTSRPPRPCTPRTPRVVSVEMFEHIMQWRDLMARVRTWLKPDGRFFMHIFTHRSGAYLFDRAEAEDWIAQHFFAGGVMPSHHLIRQYGDLFEVEKEW